MGACATAVAGGALCSGEERGGRGENGQGRRGVSTGLVHVSRARGWKEGDVDTAKREVAARAASTRPPAYWQEVEDGAAAGLGQLQCWARWAVKEVSPGGVSLSLLF